MNREMTGRGIPSPCLLPWLTAGDNVALAVRRVFPHYTRAEIREQVEKYMELVGVADSYDQKPAELSLGAQQCTSLARALAIEPKFLLLDEPFSMLDSLTRLDLQDTLLEAWERSKKVVVMVTHDIDEALYLADRIILMTTARSPGGEIYDVPFTRPPAATPSWTIPITSQPTATSSISGEPRETVCSVKTTLNQEIPTPFRHSILRGYDHMVATQAKNATPSDYRVLFRHIKSAAVHF
jgi:ABC-type sulfate/molybdate transport systems ATPase subunit